MAFIESWVETDPDGSVITGSLLDDFQRQSKRAIRERLEGDPSNPNSGIYEAGSFGGTSIVRAGTARAYAVTAAGIAALTLQDGRIAITTDTLRLFHLKATGAVELGYIPNGGDVAQNVSFNTVSSNGFGLSGVGTFASGKVYKDAVNGLILAGAAGSSYDAVITNNAGQSVLRIYAGTILAQFAGGLNIGSYIQMPGATALSGALRFATSTGINWRNSINTADIAGIYTNGAVTHVDAETSISLDKKTLMPLTSAVGAFEPSASFNVTDTGKVSTVTYANIILRLSSNASGADTTLVFTDNVTYAQYISARADVFSFRVAAVTPVSIDAGGINVTRLTTVDDQTQKLVIGRYSAGIPSSYIQIGPNSSGGLRITNAAVTLDVMILSNAGAVTFASDVTCANLVASGTGKFSGAAAAGAGADLVIGGNSSTTASSYGGGGVSALPAQPRGYFTWFTGALNVKVPYYLA